LLAGQKEPERARLGLMQVRLMQQRVDEAYALGMAGMAEAAPSAELLANMGDVYFRRGEMDEAEAAFRKALAANPSLTHAHLGLAKLYRASSMYRLALEHLKTAHELAPNDAEVRREWFRALPREERLKAIEAYLAGAHPFDEGDARLQEYVVFLRSTMDRPVHSCRLVTPVETAESRLLLLRHDPDHLRGFGLAVQLNDRKLRMMLDTGVNGIMVSTRTARRVGLEPLLRQQFNGMGDKGLQAGYRAIAKRIRIGQLEFADCLVNVSDSAVSEDDGLIGTDVFAAFLVDLAGPGERLSLSPLPARPAEQDATAALNTDDGDDSYVEEVRQTNHDVAQWLPHDAYIAPQMTGWRKVFRIGHHLLLPTSVNGGPSVLFMLDSGAFSSIVSTRLAATLAPLSRATGAKVMGMAGEVRNVYFTQDLMVQFGRWGQPMPEMMSLDLSSLSIGDGVEISGLLGFTTLQLLDVKIDYRDGLVDFVRPRN
jgi:predicted aspartyl protease